MVVKIEIFATNPMTIKMIPKMITMQLLCFENFSLKTLSFIKVN